MSSIPEARVAIHPAMQDRVDIRRPAVPIHDMEADVRPVDHAAAAVAADGDSCMAIWPSLERAAEPSQGGDVVEALGEGAWVGVREPDVFEVPLGAVAQADFAVSRHRHAWRASA